jgi:hypothetical protein
VLRAVERAGLMLFRLANVEQMDLVADETGA